jgi:hypothetical protein
VVVDYLGCAAGRRGVCVKCGDDGRLRGAMVLVLDRIIVCWSWHWGREDLMAVRLLSGSWVCLQLMETNRRLKGWCCEIV